MFIIDLTYVAPLDQLDAHMSEHMAFLKACYNANLFLTSGRKVPRTGGIILAVGKSKEAVEAIMRKDPFVKHKLSAFTVTEFQNSQTHKEFKKMMLALGA